jgi:colicin import membrane protein
MAESANSELITVARESGLEENKVEGLLSSFGESFNKTRAALANAQTVVVTDESQVAEMKKAGELRRNLKSIRVEVEHTRKKLKEQSLREGKAIDGMANIIKAMIVPAEDALEKSEKFAANLAIERQAKKLAERRATILEYTDLPERYNFGRMTDAEFSELIADLKKEKEERIEAEKRAEAERIAQAKAAEEERKKVEAENARLRAEARKKDAELAEQQAKAQAERKAIEDKAREAQAIADAKLAEERAKRQAAEKAEADRKAAEAKKTQETAEAKRQALLAPDKDKLTQLAASIEALAIPQVESSQAGKLVDDTRGYLERIAKNLRHKAQEL